MTQKEVINAYVRLKGYKIEKWFVEPGVTAMNARGHPPARSGKGTAAALRPPLKRVDELIRQQMQVLEDVRRRKEKEAEFERNKDLPNYGMF